MSSMSARSNVFQITDRSPMLVDERADDNAGEARRRTPTPTTHNNGEVVLLT